MEIRNKTIIILVMLLIVILTGVYVFRVLTSTDLCSSVDPSKQSACCAKLNKDQVTVQCAGNWTFDKSLQQCSFECDLSEEIRFCTQDVFECPDGSFVSRDGANNCEFLPCP